MRLEQHTIIVDRGSVYQDFMRSCSKIQFVVIGAIFSGGGQKLPIGRDPGRVICDDDDDDDEDGPPCPDNYTQQVMNLFLASSWGLQATYGETN